MSPAKVVKKTLSFTGEEQDQRLLARIDAAVASETYPSFNELAKAALHRLLIADAAPAPVEHLRGEERLTAVEAQMSELVNAQQTLTTTVQAWRDAAVHHTEATATHEAERLATLERALAELHTSLRHQGETLLTQLQTLTTPPRPTPAAGTDRATEQLLGSMESRQRLARFLEDF